MIWIGGEFFRYRHSHRHRGRMMGQCWIECDQVANYLRRSVWHLPLQSPGAGAGAGAGLDQCRYTLLQQRLQRSSHCRRSCWTTRGMFKDIHKWRKSGCSR